MINISSPEERRITLRLLAYWEKRRAGRLMPTEADLDPADIADLWEYCFLVHAQHIGKAGYHFTYLGKAINDLYHEGLSDEDGGRSLFPEIQAMAKGYQQVLDKAEPLVTEGEMTTLHGDHFKYRQVLLPLGIGNKVDAIFGGMRFQRIVVYK